MAVGKRDRQQRTEQGAGNAIHGVPSRDDERNPILVERLFRSDRLEDMGVPPQGERS